VVALSLIEDPKLKRDKIVSFSLSGVSHFLGWRGLTSCCKNEFIKGYLMISSRSSAWSVRCSVLQQKQKKSCMAAEQHWAHAGENVLLENATLNLDYKSALANAQYRNSFCGKGFGCIHVFAYHFTSYIYIKEKGCVKSTFKAYSEIN
jgi:hypothetical protein